MSDSNRTNPIPSISSFQASAWPEYSSGETFPVELPDDVVVIGLGESAHFVEELNHARADVVRRLRSSNLATHLALEVGGDEAPAIQAWLDHRESRALRDVVGPLTYCLYGTFLIGLRDALEPGENLVVLGVDLPNSLTVEPSLGPLASLMRRLDPDTSDLVEATRVLAAPVRGGSAAASAFSWMEMNQVEQDTLTVSLSRLRGRIDALGAVAGGTDDEADWLRARCLADAAVTTDLMLRAMADLFSGGGLPADTTLRERFIAERLFKAVNGLGTGQVIVYVAHNNHVQKSPVVFGGEVAAFPVGQLLAQRLGRRYWSLALSHLDAEVPEMVVPAPTDVGFRVERTAAVPVGDHSIEAGAATDTSGELWLVLPKRSHDGRQTTSVRSQSAVAEIPVSAFDAALVSRSATTDPVVERLVIVGVGAHQAGTKGAGS